MPLHRRSLLAWAAAGSTVPGFAFAQAGFPDRPIRLVVPNAPGGPSDIAARTIADGMRGELGQPLVVDNRAGASGVIGTTAVATAPPDGYTLLVCTRSSQVLAPLVQKSPSFDPERDFEPVGIVFKTVALFAASRQSGFKSLGDLVAYAKAHPGQLNFGSAGLGTTNHIAIEQLKQLTGTRIEHVPYKGSGPLIAALMAGEVQLALLEFASSRAGVESGAIVPLAQGGARRLAAMPGVPTLKEAGFASLDSPFWVGLVAPKGTPAAVVERLNKALNVALDSTRMKAYAQANGWTLVPGPPRAMGQLVAADIAEFRPVLKTLDLKPG